MLKDHYSKLVLVRTESAGVHFGCLDRFEATPAGAIVALSNSRRIWCWVGAASLSQIALDGINNQEETKITVQLPFIILIGVIEIIPISDAAAACLKNIPEWKA